MGKTIFHLLVFLCLCVCAPLGAQERKRTAVFESDLDSSFFLIRKNTGLAFGFLGETRKKFPPSYGTWFELPIGNRSKNHLWKTSFLYENHRGLPGEHSVLHQGYAGIQYSFFSAENSPSPSVFAGWEKNETNLAVFGIHLEIPKRQSIQFFGKTGKEFKNVSVFFHSPLNDELRLFAGVSRTWADAMCEDRFTLGIGFSAENLSASFFGNRIDPAENARDEDSSLSWKFGADDVLFSKPSNDSSRVARNTNDSEYSNSIKSDSDSLRGSPIERYAVVSFSVQELLSAGFPLSSALRISKESSRSREEYSIFLNSLNEKERSKILFLLRKKNPKVRGVASRKSARFQKVER